MEEKELLLSSRGMRAIRSAGVSGYLLPFRRRGRCGEVMFYERWQAQDARQSLPSAEHHAAHQTAPDDHVSWRADRQRCSVFGAG